MLYDERNPLMSTTAEEVVWPSKVALLTELLECTPRDSVHPGDLLPAGYHLAFGSSIYDSQFVYPFGIEIRKLSSFRVGEPIATTVEVKSSNEWNVLHGGLRGIRWRADVKCGAAKRLPEYPGRSGGRSEFDLTAKNLSVASVKFGATAPKYFGKEDRVSLAQLPEYWLVAVALSRTAGTADSTIFSFSEAFDRRNSMLCFHDCVDSSVEVVGDKNGRLLFRSDSA